MQNAERGVRGCRRAVHRRQGEGGGVVPEAGRELRRGDQLGPDM